GPGRERDPLEPPPRRGHEGGPGRPDPHLLGPVSLPPDRVPRRGRHHGEHAERRERDLRRSGGPPPSRHHPRDRGPHGAEDPRPRRDPRGESFPGRGEPVRSVPEVTMTPPPFFPGGAGS